MQFFIKASRPGDPGLGGIAGYRLVQVRLAGSRKATERPREGGLRGRLLSLSDSSARCKSPQVAVATSTPGASKSRDERKQPKEGRDVSTGAVAVILSLGALFLPSAVGLAAPTAKPSNTAEPTISGQAEQGRTLSASRGSWTGTGSISYAYRWVRCGPDGGRPDASNCGSIPGATRSRYELVGADLGYRLRVRVTASNSKGRDGCIHPDGDVVGPPVNASLPLVSGTALVGSVITVHPGSWIGRQPIGFSYAWLRCNSAGGECLGIGGATGRSYRLTSADVNHKMRVSVTARNAITSVTVLSSESAVVSVPLPAGAIRLPTGEISIPASSVPSDQRLIVSRVAFRRTRSRASPVR